jgi:hypothetical protein
MAARHGPKDYKDHHQHGAANCGIDEQGKRRPGTLELLSHYASADDCRDDEHHGDGFRR